MTDIPIIFSAPMVRALLEGRKTMTRRLAWGDMVERIVSEEELQRLERKGWQAIDGADELTTLAKPSRWQRVTPGDRLWVRESLDLRGDRPDLPIWRASYRADGAPLDLSVPANLAFAEGKSGQRRGRFINSIHMPRSFSRLTLIVESVKIEHLQDISDDDAIAEGVLSWRDGWSQKQAAEMCLRGTEASVETAARAPAVRLFYLLWTSLHGREGRKVNPEIVVISFRVIKSNIDSAEAAP